MNIFLNFGLLILTAYLFGLLLEKGKIPKTIGFILVGVIFSPETMNLIGEDFIAAMDPIMQISLAFIAFEVGGELRWSKIKIRKRVILSLTLLASLIPYLLVAAGIYLYVILFPATFSVNQANLLMLVLLLGALAAPTAPASVFAVIHQYNARGKVTETLLEVVALDDVLGILLFSLTVSILPFIAEEPETFKNTENALDTMYKVFSAIAPGILLGYLFNPFSRFLKIKRDGQWIIIIFSLIILGTGISLLLHADELLMAMTMGLVVANTCNQQKKIFSIMKRYTENLIFLIFFLLSGLHLSISVIPDATPLIIFFVLLRFFGKYLGMNLGARLVHAAPNVRKYTYGGLLPQAGIAIGLVLSIYEKESFSQIADMLLTIIMGATILNGLAGPLVAQYTLHQAGEVEFNEKNPIPENKSGERQKPTGNMNRREKG